MKILFLTLKTFSATGGIEKVCRVMGKAVFDIIGKRGLLQVKSMHDASTDAIDNPYFPAQYFKGFAGNKTTFIAAAVLAGRKNDVVILSHVNLLLAGWLIKKIAPSVKVILLCHGIEVWKPFKVHQRWMIQSIDEFIAVSFYTNQQLQEVQGIPTDKCKVLNNCLDPFLPAAIGKQKDKTLLLKYGFGADDIVLFMLSRMAATERHKGYDKVIAAMAALQKESSKTIRYLIAGKYSTAEKTFVETLAAQHGLKGQVVLAGYVPDEALAAHFALADIYIMPSKKEGFGIVFLEAMYFGLPVIAGNADGSVDALRNGELGLLVNPESVDEVKTALEKMINNTEALKPNRKLLMEHFSYEVYKKRLELLLTGECS